MIFSSQNPTFLSLHNPRTLKPIAISVILIVLLIDTIVPTISASFATIAILSNVGIAKLSLEGMMIGISVAVSLSCLPACASVARVQVWGLRALEVVDFSCSDFQDQGGSLASTSLLLLWPE